MAETLRWLGEHVVRPVLDHLPGAPRRIWWCTTGLLSYLPLHAVDLPAGWVGVADAHGAGTRQRSRASGPTRLGPRRRAAPHPGRRRPARCRGRVRRGGRRHRRRDPARRGRHPDPVLDALPRHAVAHLACHAVGDPDDPSAGRLLLRDGPLTVAEITALDLPDVQLAVLSACATAAPAGALVDEAIHLASAFRAAGYPQVVATLWAVPDRVAVRFSRTFHELVGRSRSGDAVPDAWAGAVAALRARWPGRPSVWAAFAHLGAER